MNRLLCGAAAALFMAAASPALAGDLGTHGQTFDIAERDILEMISEQLKRAEASGRMGQLQDEFKRRVQAKVERPNPVPGLVRTVEPRSWLFDPSIIVPQDFSDHRGRVFARAGQRINPLERLPGFDRILIFLDGDDAAQVDWAVGQLREGGEHRVRLILTKGAPMELMRRRRVQFYFDQEAKLSTHFGIRQVPARVEKDGDKLRISEVRP
ncbi:type-F conjugative transfer system protein TraW [Brevundimonas sp. SPF441]|jgi:conjugal transfer pilus assembly protein TraW|uniref:type-F conjugative transfer system protein TraW n=1 Tax=Brevundimonas TaxID=41275 RepID=UPI00129EDF66|nr:type-F conjugative transfer system protein TraW [Brevundimonas sp. SPF441]MBU1384725.1 type-F conjugative transfer system protein TraW [Alphaproteobacteria bacterium]MBU2271781.1 type-F conjugative transfer system protein TraW [Alphaproteobacteria bacterium]MBU2419621.1 type-F conjugative transfer system protein TraW [Alphaproteobacteria bacterium]MRL68902.1 type-F conjugative transfer system protein TraW [Brevundimonas sp. SPF441]|tara:strand:- start:29822 stop:30454 length:633 start_codon:yes stop_codon:yes gene_type:complete